MRGRMKTLKLLGLVLGICLITTAARADVYMKQKQHRDSMTIMGQEQPAEDLIDEVWITDKGMRSDNAKASIIIQPDAGKMIMIDHQKRTYSEMPFNMGKMLEKEMADADEEERAAFQGMMGKMMKIDVTVEPTGETKKIKKWNCRKYNMTMTMFSGTVSNEIWATEDVEIDQNLYNKFRTGGMLSMPGMQESVAAMETELKKIKGVQVLNISSSQMMGHTVKSSTELLEFKTAKAPANLFAIPAGYTKESREMPPRRDMPAQKPPAMKDIFKGMSGMGGEPEEMPGQAMDAPPPPDRKVDFKSLLNKFR